MGGPRKPREEEVKDLLRETLVAHIAAPAADPDNPAHLPLLKAKALYIGLMARRLIQVATAHNSLQLHLKRIKRTGGTGGDGVRRPRLLWEQTNGARWVCHSN